MLPDTGQPKFNIPFLRRNIRKVLRKRRATSDCHDNQKDERPFLCNRCGKSFGLKMNLDRHLLTHFKKRPYACHHCSRVFWTSINLRRHLVNHLSERPFKCWICGTSFRRKDILKWHIIKSHNQPEVVAEKLANEATNPSV